MPNEISTIPDALAAQEVPATIIPGAVDQSLIPGFKCRSRAPASRVLFIGGVLDGKKIAVPPDGRHYYHHTDPDDPWDNETFVYVPAVIRFKDRVTAVYLLEERILPALPEERPALGTEDQGRLAANRRDQRIAAQRRLGTTEQTLQRALALSDVRAGDIVLVTEDGVRFDRRPTAENPCTPESLVCVRSARRGGMCEYVVNGPMESRA